MPRRSTPRSARPPTTACVGSGSLVRDRCDSSPAYEVRRFVLADAESRSTRLMNLDVAVVGAGVAGTRVAHAIQRERPDWSIALFERTERIGGRLRSLQVAGVDHPIELGGMRFLTSHRRVADLVETLGIPTHAF